jgi:LPXTG-motif cell wall-anchored protein
MRVRGFLYRIVERQGTRPIDCGEPEASSGPPLPEATPEPPPLDNADQASGASDHNRSVGPAEDKADVEDAGDDDEEGHDTAGPASDSTDDKASARDGNDQRADADAKDDDERDDKDDDDDDVEQDQDQDADSGDVDQSADVINTGDNVNQCVAILQVANSGNAQNQTGIIQDDSETDEIELDNGSRINITPQLVLDCRQIIMQVVRGERAKEQPGSRLRTSQLRVGGTPVVRTSGTQGRVGPAGMVVATSSRSGAAPKVASASGAGRPKTLPRTGGFSGSYATLLGLSVGVLLVGGGLVVRRISRRV